MSGLVSKFTIPEESTLAYLRNKYCSKPIRIPSYALPYPRMGLDAIFQFECTGIFDHKRIADAMSMIGTTSDFESLISQFISQGGEYIISPLIEEVRTLKNFEIHIRPDDLVIPICHEGMNRSQVMYLVANALKSQIKCEKNVSMPHGAESGFDPHSAFTGLDGDNWYGYIHGNIIPFNPSNMSDWLTKCFYQKFGVDKSRRIGQTECETAGLVLNPTDEDYSETSFAKVSHDRTMQRKIMDNLLYDSDKLKSCTGTSGRVVVLAFCRASIIFLKRLLEVSGNKDLSNIVIVSLPYPDEISRAGGKTECAKYKEVTGIDISRDALNQIRLEEVFDFYASILKLVVCNSE
jgi:hypothetical protein